MTDLLQALGIAVALLIVAPTVFAVRFGPAKGQAWGAHQPVQTGRVPVPDFICEPGSDCCHGGGS